MDSPQNRRGTTLLELAVATSVLVIIGLLMFVVLNNTMSAVAGAEATEVAQAALRDTLREVIHEVQAAAKNDNPALAPPLRALRVINPGEIVFQVPANRFGTAWSTPITYRFVNEDDGEHEGAFNGRLDDGEDVDGDGTLTRRLMRIQDEQERPIAPANDLSRVIFSLNPEGNMLTVTLVASKTTLNRRKDQVHVMASSQVYLQN